MGAYEEFTSFNEFEPEVYSLHSSQSNQNIKFLAHSGISYLKLNHDLSFAAYLNWCIPRLNICPEDREELASHLEATCEEVGIIL